MHILILLLKCDYLESGDYFSHLGRWDEVGSELFRLQDHAGTDYLMGPVSEVFCQLCDKRSHIVIVVRS